MDTSFLAQQALNHFKTELARFGFHTSNPNYDVEGIDLVIELRRGKSVVRYLNAQSKGRTLSSTTTNVKIPVDYVDDHFVLFIYMINEAKDLFTFVFFPNQIRSFNQSKGNYVLSFNQNKINKGEFDQNRFDLNKARELSDFLKLTKAKPFTSILIDAFCLERRVCETTALYKEIYPEIEFIKPCLLDIVKNIYKCYNRFSSSQYTVNSFLFHTPHNSLDTAFDFQHGFISEAECYIEETKIRCYEMKIDGIVSFEIQDYLERLVHSENIILIADDITYSETLEELKKEGFNIILVTGKKNNLNVQGFKWGDIAYPIGLSLGLERYQL
jgi:hypothetical protein